jgi:hypothetical protein
LIWDPITKLVSPQFHVVFDDNFETVQQPNRDDKIDDTMDILFKTNNYKYDDPFDNAHSYIFSYGGVEIHPDSLSPDIKTCQEYINVTSTINESSTTSETNSPDINNTRSIMSIKDIQILHTINIFPQNRKDELQAYKHLHGIDMQIHTIPKRPHQKIHDMGL